MTMPLVSPVIVMGSVVLIATLTSLGQVTSQTQPVVLETIPRAADITEAALDDAAPLVQSDMRPLQDAPTSLDFVGLAPWHRLWPSARQGARPDVGTVRLTLPALARKDQKPKTGDSYEAIDAIEMMKAVAAETRRMSQEKSQLDVILATLETSQKTLKIRPPKKIGPDSLAQAVRPLPAAAQRTAPGPAQTSTLAAIRPTARPTAQPVARPMARPVAKLSPSSGVPPFSAQHFHRLRFHGHHTPSDIACVEELRLMASRIQIYFNSGSAAVDARGASAARLIAAKAQSCTEAQIGIIGFTDPGGSIEINQKLSWQRANAVFRSIQNAGFMTERIEVSSHMEDHPEECLHYEGIDRRVVFDVREVADG